MASISKTKSNDIEITDERFLKYLEIQIKLGVALSRNEISEDEYYKLMDELNETYMDIYLQIACLF